MYLYVHLSDLNAIFNQITVKESFVELTNYMIVLLKGSLSFISWLDFVVEISFFFLFILLCAFAILCFDVNPVVLFARS